METATREREINKLRSELMDHLDIAVSNNVIVYIMYVGPLTVK
jgi:hypothetical protein